MINYTTIKHFIPKPAITFLRAKWRKFQAMKIRKKKQHAIKKYGTFKPKELYKKLQELNIKEGDCLFVQCSFNDLYTFSGSPLELLESLKVIIGEEGTIFFPAYINTSKLKQGKPINLAITPTYTGIVNEIFRRSPGVIRSNHPRHSICGLGPLADEILKDHQKCQYADGKDSPFDRMRKLDNAKILTLGLPNCYMSFLHWIEDIDPSQLPFHIHKKKSVQHELISSGGDLHTVKDFEIDESLVKLSLPHTCKKLSKNVMLQKRYKGISINMYLMKPLAKELLLLRDRGIIHYKQEH